MQHVFVFFSLFFVFFRHTLGPDLQPVSAHVGHNGRLLSAVEVVIIRHGARHRGGAHCSPQSVTTEGELIVHSVGAPPSPLPQQLRASHMNIKLHTLQPGRGSDVSR